MDLIKEIIKEKFKEDIEDIKKGCSITEYYIEDQGKLEPRNESMPNNLKTYERIMELVISHSNKLYEYRLQFAIAVKDFGNWCIDRDAVFSYAGFDYYRNKDTL